MSVTEDLRQVWRTDDDGVAAPALEDTRRDADLSYQALRKRDRAEYAACLAVCLCLASWR